MDVETFARGVRAYRLTFSGSITSWGRTVERNAAVGGVANSAHLADLAVDIVYDGSAPGVEADRLLAAHGLKRIREGDHDHIMPQAWPPR
jgi:hypothetical protein